MEQLRIHPDERFEIFVVFDPVKRYRIARNRLLQPVQRRIDRIRLAGFNLSIFLALRDMSYGQHCNQHKPESMQLNEYRQQSEYCFTSLSAQSWQYRDRRKPEVGTLLYSYRMTSRVLYSAQYHRQHCALKNFEEFVALYMHNFDDTHTCGRDSRHNWTE